MSGPPLLGPPTCSTLVSYRRERRRGSNAYQCKARLKDRKPRQEAGAEEGPDQVGSDPRSPRRLGALRGRSDAVQDGVRGARATDWLRQGRTEGSVGTHGRE